MTDINKVCDYIILMCTHAGEQLNFLKLQKLLYYVQAWHLAFSDAPMFRGKFQAWVHGPVNRQIYDRFVATKSLYSWVDSGDISPGFNPETDLSPTDVLHVNGVLEAYAAFSGSELEAQTHAEEPWIAARGNCRPADRCETELDERLMAAYYRRRLPDQPPA